MGTITLKGRSITSGVSEGEALVTNQTFCFTHGIEPATGCISDEMHEWLGQNVNGKVLIFPYGKGSSTGGLWILEALRLGNAPAAVINLEVDPVLASGSSKFNDILHPWRQKWRISATPPIPKKCWTFESRSLIWSFRTPFNRYVNCM